MAADEHRAAWLATGSALIVVAGFVASKAARDALLLSSFAVTSLPIFIGVSAVLSLPIIVLAGRLMTRLSPGWLMPMINAISAALLVVEWLLLARSPRPVTVVIFFHLSIAGSVLVSGFWSIVNERFDVQTAKRHIGRIGMGATLGGIIGGVIAERTAVYLPHDEILLVLAAMQIVSAAALYRFGRGARRPIEAVEGPFAAARVVFGSRLLHDLGAIVILVAVAGGLLDYVFKAELVRTATRSELLRSLSVFYTITAILSAAVQIAVSGPVVARLGVPRSVGTLPATVTVFGALALLAPGALMAAVARGAEMVTRNSIYRAGYELLYAPLAEEHKRPSKVVLDVGADRIGDLLGAQVVAAIVYVAVMPRTALLLATVITGAIAIGFALRLPRRYTEALEASLRARAGEARPASPTPPPGAEPWITLRGMPTWGAAGETVLLERRRRAARAARAAPPTAPRAAPPRGPGDDDALLATARELRSGDVGRIRRALAGRIDPIVAPLAIDAIGRDEIARDAQTALRALAPHCTGALVDALLDPARDPAVRRRLPSVLLGGDPALAAWGLWRGLADPSFDVRYRCGVALAQLAEDGHLADVDPDDVFETVKREVLVAPGMRSQRALMSDLLDSELRLDGEPRAAVELEHVFTVLGLALPAEPLRIALRALHTHDETLRGTALEYLESILPPDVRAQLWPLLDGAGDAAPLAARTRARSHDELLGELRRAYHHMVDKLEAS